MAKSVRVQHEFEPVFDERSRILMLGTMPSPRSREVGFSLRTSQKPILE